MNLACSIVGAIAPLTFFAGPLSAQEKIKEGAESTKNALSRAPQ